MQGGWTGGQFIGLESIAQEVRRPNLPRWLALRFSTPEGCHVDDGVQPTANNAWLKPAVLALMRG